MTHRIPLQQPHQRLGIDKVARRIRDRVFLMCLERWPSLIGSDAARQALYLSAGSAIAQFITLASSIFLTRIYSSAEIGLFAMYQAACIFISVISSCQYEQAIMLPRSNKQANAILLFALAFSAAASATLTIPIIAIRSPIAYFLNAPGISNTIWVLPLSAVLLAWCSALRLSAMRRAAFIDVACNIAVRAGATGVLACMFGAWLPLPPGTAAGLVLAHVIGETLGNLLLLRSILKHEPDLIHNLRWIRLRAVARRHRRLAMTLTLTQGMLAVYSRLPVVIIGWLFGTTFAGYYSIAERFALLPTLLVANAVGAVYWQRASVAYHHLVPFDSLMRKTVSVAIGLAVLPFGLGILIAPPLFEFAFGPGWADAGRFAQILMVGGCAAFVALPVDKAALIHGRTRYILLWNLARATLEVATMGATAVIGWTVTSFLWALVAVRIVLYAIDLACQYRLASSSPIRTVRGRR